MRIPLQASIFSFLTSRLEDIPTMAQMEFMMDYMCKISTCSSFCNKWQFLSPLTSGGGEVLGS
jgi:hypothetical protein